MQLVLKQHKPGDKDMLKESIFKAYLYLDEGVEQQGVDFPVVAQAKQTSKQSTHQHSKAQVIAQRETLAKDATVKTGHSFVDYPETSKQPGKNGKSIPEEHANSIGHEKAVIQNAKEGLIIAVIYRGDAKKNHFFSYVRL